MVTTKSFHLLAGVCLVAATVVACSASPEEDDSSAENEAALQTYADMQAAAKAEEEKQVPVPVKAVPPPKNCKDNSLGITQRAYIAPVDCNKFVDAMGVRWPIGAGNGKALDWRAFCVATNKMFSENSTNSTFRMSLSGSFEVKCCDGAIDTVKINKTSCEMGEEKAGPVVFGQGVNSGCFTSAGKNGKFETMLSGHPPEQAEVGMQLMGPRTCSDIWASTKGTFACGADNVARFTSVMTASSNFPSNTFRIFENSTKVGEKDQAQGNMDTLWECDKAGKVAGGTKGIIKLPAAAVAK